MIEHAWSLICTKCITDPESKNVTLVEVVQQLNGAPGTVFPILAPFQTDFVSTWYRTNPERGSRATGKIVVHSPTGNALQATQFAIDLTEFYRTHVIIRSAGIQLDAVGVYYFAVSIRVENQEQWREVARIPLNVTVMEGAAVAVAAEARH